MRIKRNVLLSFSLCMLARCFGVVSASITAINVAVFCRFLDSGVDTSSSMDATDTVEGTDSMLALDLRY